MPIFKVENGNVTQAHLKGFENERQLQRFFESNLSVLLGLRFIGTEVTTGDRQRGRIDTLAIDQDGTPTLIEYKKQANVNVVTQGLFYLDWLIDHRGDFTVAAQQRLGANVEIDWTSPRLILIAEDFSEYDKYAVNRIGANIELWVYRLYTGDLLYLDPIFIPTIPRTMRRRHPVEQAPETAQGQPEEPEVIYDLEYHLHRKPEEIRELFGLLRDRIFSIGEAEEITENPTKIYISYKHGRNFCEVEVFRSYLKIWLDFPFADIKDPLGLTRDMTNIGHHGTGDIEIKLSNPEELDAVEALIRQSYNSTV
ncbi:MAG: DUF5655 domain-containing protein [Bellilinea sp.]